MKNAIVLISHSQKITDGLKEMLESMVNFEPDQLQIYSAGGTDDGEIGTTAMRVLNAFQEASEADQVYVFCDMGSAVLSANTAIGFLDEEVQEKFSILSDAPLVEGAYVGAVECSIDASKDELIKAVEEQ